MSAPRAGAGEVRVEDVEIFGGHKDQLVGPLRPADPRRSQRRDARTGGFEQISSKRDNLPLSYCWFILFEIVSRITSFQPSTAGSLVARRPCGPKSTFQKLPLLSGAVRRHRRPDGMGADLDEQFSIASCYVDQIPEAQI